MSLFFYPFPSPRCGSHTTNQLSRQRPHKAFPYQSHTDWPREIFLMINHETSRADKGRCGSCTIKAFYNYTYRLAPDKGGCGKGLTLHVIL